MPFLYILLLTCSLFCQTSHCAEIDTKLTPLMEAIFNDDLKFSISELEKDNININAQDKHGRTALFWAAQENRPDIIKLLLEKKDINVNLTDHEGLTPLAIAIRLRHNESALILLNDVRVDFNIEDSKSKQSPLITSILTCNLEILRLMLTRCPEINLTNSATALAFEKFVINEKSKEVLQELDAYFKRSSQFCDALKKQEHARATNLLNQGFELNAINPVPALFATFLSSGKFEIIKKLIELKASLTIFDYSIAPYIADHGDPNVMEYFIKMGVNPNSVEPDGETLLHHAINSGNNETAKLLIKYGANPFKRSNIKILWSESNLRQKLNMIPDLIFFAPYFNTAFYRSIYYAGMTRDDEIMKNIIDNYSYRSRSLVISGLLLPLCVISYFLYALIF